MAAGSLNANVRSVQVAGRTLSYTDVGTGEACLLLHSGGFSSRQWRKLIEALAKTYRVLAPDLLGYGASSAWPNGTVFDLSQDVEALTALLQVVAAPVHLVGHSYGGSLALHLAADDPARALSLALYDPVAFSLLDAQKDERRGLPSMLAPDAAGSLNDAWLRSFIEWWNGPGAWDQLNAETKENFRKIEWKMAQEVESLGRDQLAPAQFQRIQAPTLLLGGGKSPATEHLVLHKLAALIPRSRLEMLADLGHMGPIVEAPRINALIAAHIDAAAATRKV